MKRQLGIYVLSLLLVTSLLYMVAATATAQQQTTTDMEVALTTTVSDPEVLAVPALLEIHGLDPRRVPNPSARICYDYFTQSGAYTRTACRSVVGADLTDTTSTQSLFDVIAPRTSTAQPPDDQRRVVSRLRAWTNSQGGPPEPPTATSTTGTMLPRPRPR